MHFNSTIVSPTLFYRLSLFFWVICLAIPNALNAMAERSESETELQLASCSFNAKKRSWFGLDGQKEYAQRGLTVIHFNSSSTVEYKTLDTYGSVEARQEVLELLRQLRSKQAYFVLLAHDSAVPGSFGDAAALEALGFESLAALKSREAYVAHNLNGELKEWVDGTELNQNITVPEGISDPTIYFPKETYTFDARNDRYIAHAAGVVNGVKSTNSIEALDANYKKGFRYFELDIITTSDGHLVAAHDWKMWARFTDFQGSLPPSLKEFKKHKIYGDYRTMDLPAINAWFAAHPDAYLVTDKLNDPMAFAQTFVDKDRLIMELFSRLTLEEASRNGIAAMISQEPLLALRGKALDYLAINNIQYAAVSRRIVSSHKKLLASLRDQGVKVFVYNVNFDPGKDEVYVQENELGLVYGMYADNWVFDAYGGAPKED
ncbi:glycerophosphodiester phosphodiesterase family protein [Flagellimonas sp. DF-77]|uniref:glycerophosphodiester phosphodiesterase family protein n=1 Tax=Flagellimonas algarum TaxID=3230298 RepID=UPI003399DC1A